MAKLDDATILDIVSKMAVGVASSSNLRNYFEEEFDWFPQLTLNDLFAEPVPVAGDPTAADANVLANPTKLEKLTTRQMDPLHGSNNEAYAVFTTPGDNTSLKLINFLKPQKFGDGYAFTLFENDGGTAGDVIALTDGAFQFDYATGILRFNDTNRPVDEGWTTANGPLFMTGYRYIGLTGAVVGAPTTFISAFDSSSAAPPVSFTGGVLTVTHSLGTKYISGIQIYDDTDEIIIPDSITAIDTTKLDIDLTSFSTIPGTWHVSISI